MLSYARATATLSLLLLVLCPTVLKSQAAQPSAVVLQAAPDSSDSNLQVSSFGSAAAKAENSEEKRRFYSEAVSNLIGDIERVLKILGILFAGVLGYIKFIKGRLFHPKLEFHVTCVLEESKQGEFLVAEVTLKNVGLTRVELSQTGTALSVSASRGSIGTGVDWDPITILSMFENHAWIEPGETISEPHVIAIQDPASIYRCEARLVAQKKEWNASYVCTEATSTEEAS